RISHELLRTVAGSGRGEFPRAWMGDLRAGRMANQIERHVQLGSALRRADASHAAQRSPFERDRYSKSAMADRRGLRSRLQDNAAESMLSGQRLRVDSVQRSHQVHG